MDRKTFFRRYSRSIQRLGLGSLAVGIVAAILKAWLTHWLGPSSLAVKPEPVVAEVQKVETVEDLLNSSPISLMEWQISVEKRYGTEAERERQFRNYLGKEMIWEGYFDQLNPIPKENSNAPGFVLVMQESRAALDSKSLLGPPFIRCWCPVGAEKELSSLKRGEWIVIRGRLKNPTLLGSVLCTDLDACELVATQEVRHVEMTLDDARGKAH
ncbi:hypothetical protein [Planctomicrobium sp. SH527]|uniref:hypothetical protein n=1 Tax=Planctomicrobium sp. SH527 TaxID=3448123 RepID=UPI003F5B4439